MNDLNKKYDSERLLQRIFVWLIVISSVLLIAYISTRPMVLLVSGLVGCDIYFSEGWGSIDYVKFWFKSLVIVLVLIIAIVSFVLGLYFYFKNYDQIASSLQSPSPKKWMVAGALLGAATSRGGSRRAARGALLGWVGHKMVYSGREALLFGLILVMPYVFFKSIGDDLFCNGIDMKNKIINPLQTDPIPVEIIPPLSIGDSVVLKEAVPEDLSSKCVLSKNGDQIGEEASLCRSSVEMKEINEVVLSSMKYSESPRSGSQMPSSEDVRSNLKHSVQDVAESTVIHIDNSVRPE